MLPCVIGGIVGKFNQEVGPWIALSGLLWPIVGVAGVLIRWGDKKRAKRTLELAKLAESWNMRFTYRPQREQYAGLESFQLMADPHAQVARNMFEGAFQNSRLWALDYEFRYFLGVVNLVGKQTVVVLENGFERLPEFAIVPQNWAERLENSIMGKSFLQSFVVPGAHDFNHYFAVAGDPAEVLPRLSPEAVQFFLQDKGLTLEVNAGRILLFRRENYLRPEEYGPFLRTAASLAIALNRGL